MFGLGTIVNTIAVVAGGIIGLLYKNGLKNRYQETIMQGIGLAVLFVGISGAMTGMLKISKEGLESTGSLILVLSLCFGAFCAASACWGLLWDQRGHRGFTAA